MANSINSYQLYLVGEWTLVNLQWLDTQFILAIYAFIIRRCYLPDNQHDLSLRRREY